MNSTHLQSNGSGGKDRRKKTKQEQIWKKGLEPPQWDRGRKQVGKSKMSSGNPPSMHANRNIKKKTPRAEL